MRYAILIGIDDYPSAPLQGAVRDVQNVKRLLESEPEPVCLYFFIAPRDEMPTPSQQKESQTCRPTYNNITSILTDVTSMAKPGDLVYIHFAGHGTKSKKPGRFEKSNKSTGDLALVLLDENSATGEKCLLGYVLGFSLNVMVENGLIVTLVLDCCFSAAVYRRDPFVRFVEHNHKWDSEPTDTQELTLEGKENTEASRDASFGENWLLDPEGYAILAACQPNDEARELQRGDEIQGALSHFLLKALSNLGGLGAKHRDIFRHLTTTFRKHSLSQRPAYFGNGDQRFFCSRGLEFRKGLVGVFQAQDGKYILQAGQAHGVSVGDQVILYLHNDSSADGQAAAKVSVCGPLTSELDVSCVAKTVFLECCDASITAQASLQNLPVCVATGSPRRAAWSTALKKRSLDNGRGDEQSFSIKVVLDNDEYHVRDDLNRTVTSLSTMPEEGSVDRVCDLVQHLARFTLVRDLTNNTPNHGFCDSFDLWMVHNSKKFAPGSIIDVQDGERLEIHVENNRDEELYLYVYDLGPFWQVANGLGQSPRFIPSKTSGEGFDPKSVVKLRMNVPEKLKERGQRQCEDIVKILITTQPTSFDLFELPGINQSMAPSSVEGATRVTGVDGPEDWAAFNFTVRTACTADAVQASSD